MKLFVIFNLWKLLYKYILINRYERKEKGTQKSKWHKKVKYGSKWDTNSCQWDVSMCVCIFVPSPSLPYPIVDYGYMFSIIF